MWIASIASGPVVTHDLDTNSEAKRIMPRAATLQEAVTALPPTEGTAKAKAVLCLVPEAD